MKKSDHKKIQFELTEDIWGDSNRVMLVAKNYEGDIFDLERVEIKHQGSIPCWFCLKPIGKTRIIQPIHNIRRKELHLVPTCSKECAEKTKIIIDGLIEKLHS